MPLEVGRDAPEFSLTDQHGQTQTLTARHGRRNVLLVFYPFAFTGVCSGEMRAVSERAEDWDRLATDVLAVSCDPVASLRAFADQERLEHPLLSDFWPHGAVSASYGAFDETLGAAGRSTYVIDRDSVIRWQVHSELRDARDVADYLVALAAL